MNTPQKLPTGFILFSALALITIFILEHINHRFWLNDFKVYYGAAKSLVNHQQVYGVAYGLDSGLYKYSPFIALVVAPLTFFTFEAAAVVQYFLIATSIVVLFIVTWKIIKNEFFQNTLMNENLILVLAFICIITHIFREEHLGNVNAELLLLMCLSLACILDSKPVSAGILLAIVI